MRSTARSCIAYRARMTLDEDAILAIIARIRAGETLTIGSSSDSTTWSFDGESFVAEWFDQGRGGRRTIDEAELRGDIEAMPQHFVTVLDRR